MSAGEPIKVAELPKVAVFPLSQHIGAPAKAIVQKGDKVKAGAPVVRLDRKQLQNTEIDLTTMVVFTDGYDKPVNLDCYGDRVEAGQILIQD